jgi:hypothetical protein
MISRYFERIPQQSFRGWTGKHIALQIEFSGMTGAYQLIIEFVVTDETSQVRANSGKGDEAAAFPVNDDHGYFVENDFLCSAWRYVFFIDG